MLTRRSFWPIITTNQRAGSLSTNHKSFENLPHQCKVVLSRQLCYLDLINQKIWDLDLIHLHLVPLNSIFLVNYHGELDFAHWSRALYTTTYLQYGSYSMTHAVWAIPCLLLYGNNLTLKYRCEFWITWYITCWILSVIFCTVTFCGHLISLSRMEPDLKWFNDSGTSKEFFFEFDLFNFFINEVDPDESSKSTGYSSRGSSWSSHKLQLKSSDKSEINRLRNSGNRLHSSTKVFMLIYCKSQ